MREQQYIHIDEDGNKYYYKDKEMTIRHRSDGPAVEYSHGTKSWLVDKKLHRLDGPAIEYINGRRSWFIKGESLSEKEFNIRTAPTLELTLEDIAVRFCVDVSKIKIVK
jgi:hypothetical protein